MRRRCRRYDRHGRPPGGGNADSFHPAGGRLPFWGTIEGVRIPLQMEAPVASADDLYAQVPFRLLSDPAIDRNAVMLYVALRYYTNFETRVGHASRKQLMAMARNDSVGSYMRARGDLERFGWVQFLSRKPSQGGRAPSKWVLLTPSSTGHAACPPEDDQAAVDSPPEDKALDVDVLDGSNAPTADPKVKPKVKPRLRRREPSALGQLLIEAGLNEP